MNHLSEDYFSLEEKNIFPFFWVNCVDWFDNSTRSSGCVWTATQSEPHGNTKDFTPVPRGGHYFWLWPQGQPADLPKGRGPAGQPLTGFTAYPELTAMTTAHPALVIHCLFTMCIILYSYSDICTSYNNIIKGITTLFKTMTYLQIIYHMYLL